MNKEAIHCKITLILLTVLVGSYMVWHSVQVDKLLGV